MGRSGRLARLEAELATREAAFRTRLTAALVSCAQGQWGLFRQNGTAADKFLSKDVLGLLAEGDRIDALRARLGMPANALHAQLLAYRSHRGANAPGEPRLAVSFLEVIAAGTLA